jgi:hypothetical protein
VTRQPTRSILLLGLQLAAVWIAAFVFVPSIRLVLTGFAVVVVFAVGFAAGRAPEAAENGRENPDEPDQSVKGTQSDAVP